MEDLYPASEATAYLLMDKKKVRRTCVYLDDDRNGRPNMKILISRGRPFREGIK